jgi:hypothetical protein
MDPEANLLEQHKLATRLVNGIAEMVQTSQLEDDAHRLAELVLALNDWICMGGHLPPAWKEGQAR